MKLKKKIVQIKSAKSKPKPSLIFPMQESLGNEKSLVKL